MTQKIMTQMKRASKGKRTNMALTVLGVAGASLVASAACSAAVLSPAGAAPAMPMGEEEISGVTLATFQLLDQEKAAKSDSLLQLAYGHGHGGHGCRCRGCGGRCRGCGGGWGGCGCGGGCCLSWGACRWIC